MWSYHESKWKCLQTLETPTNLHNSYYLAETSQLFDGFLARIPGAVSRQNPKFHCFTLYRTKRKKIHLEIKHSLNSCVTISTLTWHGEIFLVGAAHNFIWCFGRIMLCLLLIAVVGVAVVLLILRLKCRYEYANIQDCQQLKAPRQHFNALLRFLLLLWCVHFTIENDRLTAQRQTTKKWSE